jgi:hypothetical protein
MAIAVGVSFFSNRFFTNCRFGIELSSIIFLIRPFTVCRTTLVPREANPYNATMTGRSPERL